MFNYTYDQLSKIISIPIITILLLWTIIIFHKNRKRWAPYDIPIVAILVQSILRNLSILIFTILKATNDTIDFDYCSVGVWLFNSLHTFQATSLTTLALVGTFSIKLRRKQQNIKQYLTSTHLIYHLFCLTTLCACVGVAAILAQDNINNDGTCLLLPFELDIKFYVFIMVLHVFLATVSIISFVIICYHHYKMKNSNFDYIKKSTSDLSDLSLGLSTIANPNENIVKNYYDTYTIPRNSNNNNMNINNVNTSSNINNNHNNNGYDGGNYVREAWNSDLSNISTTVSSTNSRKPCLGKQHSEEDIDRSGLETIHPVLIVSYLFHHIPLIILCAFPHLISPWSVTSIGLWLGLLQDLLIPISLGIVDSRFGKWISKVYRCTDRRRRIDDKLPQVGLDGKFRPFGSQPQSLEVNQLPNSQERRLFQNNDHKFPITNGSLYTSIDGRLPIIHNYRRPKDSRGHRQDGHLMNLGLHSSHLKRVDYIQQQDVNYQKQTQTTLTANNYVCINCTNTNNNSNSNNNNVPITKKFNLNQLDQSIRNRMDNVQNPLQIKSVTYHDNNLSNNDGNDMNITNIEINEESAYNDQHLKRTGLLNLDNINNVVDDDDDDDEEEEDNSITSSDDEYYPDSMNNINDGNNNDNNFDTLSSKSSYSITTEANCDFDFYQSNLKIDLSDNNNFKNYTTPDGNVIFIHNSNNNSNNEKKCFRAGTPKVTKKIVKPTSKNSSTNDINEIGINFKITRSNSKRSLENLQAYLDDNLLYNTNTMFKSNSFVTLNDNSAIKTTKLRDYNVQQHKKIVDALQDIRNNKTLLEINDDHRLKMRHQLQQQPQQQQQHQYLFKIDQSHYSGSVPDFKKVFISDYL